MNDRNLIRGHGEAVLTSADGHVLQVVPFENLVTLVGNQMYGERGAGLSGQPAAPTGMQLGTSTTVAAATGTGSAIVTYISGSAVALAATATSSNPSAGVRRITYSATWGAGTATSSTINEAILQNGTATTNAAATSGNTIARVVFGSTINKGASDTLTVTWNHDLGS